MSTEVQDYKLQKERVYPQLMYLNPKSNLQKALFIIGTFSFAPIYFIFELNSAQFRDISLTWVSFWIVNLIIIDLLHRLQIFPEKKKKYIIFIGLFAVLFALLIAISTLWVISWNLKRYPVLERLFS